MQRKIGNDSRPSVPVKGAAVLCLLAGLAGQAVFAGFVVLLGLDLLAARPALPAPWPWVIDLGWLAAFALQHSGMARLGLKRAWTRVLSPSLERAVYVGLSGVLLAGLSLTWQPLPGAALWRLPDWVVVVSLAGLLGTAAVLQVHDPFRFFGVRQAWEAEPGADERLRVVGPYRYVRHPLMSCTLLFLWGLPVMSPTLALLSGGLTVYVLFALRLEERDLRRQFGAAYEEYRRRVPALVPWRPPLSPEGEG
jgi:methanethiol S-methyltransferase